MKQFGHLIKFERTKQQMKQSTLARGICSTSYLSKIENNRALPSEEVLQLLFERLNINPDDLENNSDQEKNLEELQEIYKELTITKSKEFAQEKLEYLQTNQLRFKSDHEFYLWNLIIARLYINLKEMDKSGFYLDYLKEEEDNLKDQLKYYFYKFQGMFEYELNNIDQSIKFMNMALLIGKDIYLPDWEEADINYMISLCYLADEHIINCIMYIKEALSYFQANFKFKRVIECYIVLGVSYKKAYLYDKAKDTYSTALKLAEELNLTSFREIIYHNIGALHALCNSKDSIKFFKMSLEYRKDSVVDLESIFCIMKEYSKQHDWQQVEDWSVKGLNLIDIADNKELQRNYYHHFTLYHALSTKGYIPEDISEAAIKFFDESKDFKYCIRYNNLIGKQYYERGKYKLAASYFENANNYILKEKRITHWEDL